MEHPDALNDDFNLSTSTATTVLEAGREPLAGDSGGDDPFRTESDPAVRERRADAGAVDRQGAIGARVRSHDPRSTRCSTSSWPWVVDAVGRGLI